MLESTIRDPISEHIVLFVNSVSGGQSGKRFIDLEIQNIDFTFDRSRVRLSIYDLLDSQSKIDGLERVKMESRLHPVKVIVCGGDGTVLWVVEEIVKYGIDIENVVIGIVPIGTGNDFSRSTGWGGEQTVMIGKKLQKLKQLVKEWLNAIVMNFDIWEVEMSVHDDGMFKKGTATGSRIEETKIIKRPFSNYCSLGIDGRIGYSFDKMRSSSRVVNLAIYGGIGIQKSFKTSPPINKIVERMYIKKSIKMTRVSIPNEGKEYLSKLSEKVSHELEAEEKKGFIVEEPKGAEGHSQNPENVSRKKVEEIVKENMEKSKQAQEKLGSEEGEEIGTEQTIFSNIHPIKKLDVDLLNIAALNIESYMGGVTNIWNKAQPATEPKAKTRLTPSSPSDGVIEIVGWKGQTGLALERFFNMAYKVNQGQGPFHFQFQHQHLTEAFHTYLQVDGQFWKVINPKEMIIRKSATIPNSRIKVLRHR